MIDPSYRADLTDAPEVVLPTKEAVVTVARHYIQGRPTVDLCRCPNQDSLIRAVVAALTAAGLLNAAQRFERRAKSALGPNALVQVAGDYVVLVRSM